MPASRPAPHPCEALFQQFPGRAQQIKTLSTLVDPSLAPSGNIVVHGTEAAGKTSVTTAVLEAISAANTSDTILEYAVIDSNKCVTTRHLFERTVANVAEAMQKYDPAASGDAAGSRPPPRKCETLAQLTVDLCKLLNKYGDVPGLPITDNNGDCDCDWRFVLVFDAVDRQRDAPLTLLPGLARLTEIVPNLTVVFIVTFPPPSMLRTSFVPHVQFGNYSKAEFVEILSRAPPPLPLPLPGSAHATAEETAELWVRLCTAVHDSLTRTAGRTLTAFREACMALWPKFTAPIAAGTHGPREFSKLLIAARFHFQDESLLDPGFVVSRPAGGSQQITDQKKKDNSGEQEPPAARHLASLLPTAARLFLLCAYLASHNAGRHDMTLFSTYYHGRKRRHGGAAGLGALNGGSGAGSGRQGARVKHRKIARKLLGAHSFTLERLLAIYAAVRSEWTRAPPATAWGGKHSAAALMDGDCHMAIATLASLRLVLRVSGQASDPMDRAGKWRVNVGWEVVRSLGRSMGIEMEEWLID